MITAQENLTLMSEATGFDHSELRTVDKSLAAAGLRMQTIGRARADMKRVEMLRLLLGVMGAPVLTKPVEYVKDAQKFRFSRIETLPTGDEEARKNLVANLPETIGVSQNELKKKSLIDVLLEVTDHLVAKNPNPNPKDAKFGPRLWLEVEMNGPIAIQIASGDYRGEVIFVGAVDYLISDKRRTTTVSQHTLEWIGRNSERP